MKVMQTTIKPTVLNTGTTKEKKPGKIWLIIAVIFFILMFVPDPLKFVPIVGEGEELLEGGISFSALLIYAVRYWLYQNIKEHFTEKK
jgi:hypothetical protein